MKHYTNAIPKEALDILKMLQEHGYAAYFVGGCVRDMLLKKEPHDYDIATEATPDKVQELFEKTVPTSLQHGTVTVMCHKEGFEVTTFRKDGTYTDNRRPSEVFFTNRIEEDLARRDFTINAMAYDPLKNRLVDPFGGRIDLQKGVIRAVRNADARFKEDALRILRALRFACKYGFKIEKETSIAMLNNAKLLNAISKERITWELRNILSSNQPIAEYFKSYALLIAQIIPEIAGCIDFKQNNKWHKHNVYEHMLAVVDACDTTDFSIKLAALLHDIGKPHTYTVDEEGYGHFYGHSKVSREITERVLAKDLVLTKKERERVLELVEFHDMAIVSAKSSVKKMLNRHGTDFCYDWAVLKKADLEDHICPKGKEAVFLDSHNRFEVFQTLLSEIDEEKSAFGIKDLKISGHDLMSALFIKEGPVIGQINRQLLNEVMEERAINEKDALLMRAKELYNEYEL